VIDMMGRLLLALLLISPASFADFNCEVKDMYLLSDDGSLSTPSLPWHIGSVFVVNRISGEVSGKSAPMLDMTVLSVGDDKDYAWKGISTRVLKRVIESANSRSGVVSSAGNGLDALWISTFKKGPNKPFIYYDETAVFTGICTVF
jgi:hypothetical protein